MRIFPVWLSVTESLIYKTVITDLTFEGIRYLSYFNIKSSQGKH